MSAKLDQRFHPEIQAINEKIAAFNCFLNSKIQVPLLDAERMVEDNSCVKILHGRWNDFSWPTPNKDKRGVYFIFGREITTDKNGTYIGKASFGSAIGRRLDSHLRPHMYSEQFVMNGYRSEKYILEYMATISLDCCNIGFLASGLEEYLISELKTNLNLINGTGN